YGDTLLRRKDAATKFLVAYLHGVRDYNDAFQKNKNKQDVIDILSKHTTVKDPAVWAKLALAYIDPNGMVDPKSFQNELDWYLQRGFLKEKIDQATLLDPSFAQAAVKT